MCTNCSRPIHPVYFGRNSSPAVNDIHMTSLAWVCRCPAVGDPCTPKQMNRPTPGHFEKPKKRRFRFIHLRPLLTAMALRTYMRRFSPSKLIIPRMLLMYTPDLLQHVYKQFSQLQYSASIQGLARLSEDLRPCRVL